MPLDIGFAWTDQINRGTRTHGIYSIFPVASQPWPFPDSLMIGFTAQYQSGNIRIDPEEIAEAGWFGPDELPLIPDAYTLAGQLIRNFSRLAGAPFSD